LWPTRCSCVCANEYTRLTGNSVASVKICNPGRPHRRARPKSGVRKQAKRARGARSWTRSIARSGTGSRCVGTCVFLFCLVCVSIHVFLAPLYVVGITRQGWIMCHQGGCLYTRSACLSCICPSLQNSSQTRCSLGAVPASLASLKACVSKHLVLAEAARCALLACPGLDCNCKPVIACKEGLTLPCNCSLGVGGLGSYFKLLFELPLHLLGTAVWILTCARLCRVRLRSAAQTWVHYPHSTSHVRFFTQGKAEKRSAAMSGAGGGSGRAKKARK